MKFSHTITTQATPDALWTAWTAVEDWPLWDSELTSAELLGPFELGATGRLTPRRGPISKFSISQLDWGNSYTFTTQLPLCRLHIHRFITPVISPGSSLNSSLSFTHEVSFEGPLSFIFGRVLGKRFQQVLPSVMESLKRNMEDPM